LFFLEKLLSSAILARAGDFFLQWLLKINDIYNVGFLG
jgi:hypothetical protein